MSFGNRGSPPALLSAIEVERLIRQGLSMASFLDMKVERVAPGTAEIRIPYQPWMLRPGGSVAGPILMMAADTAMYAVILAHTDGQEMALTANLSIEFLARPVPGDIRAEGQLLKLGRRLAVVDVRVHGEDGTLIAHASGSYMMPAARRVAASVDTPSN